MARKTKTVTMDSGRDAGKTFLITEMPLLQADRWAQQALFALARSGIETQQFDEDEGMLGMAKVALNAISHIDPLVGNELMNELLTCVQIVPSGGVARDLIFDDDSGDIEDVKTLFMLRKEALMIHLDFLTAGSSPDTNN
ncbi:hypothetical protein J3U68_08300 [Snodgrassella sp. B3882]|uniref:hypothetical protein n=1 Tax=Snodgrassella sp. B3882 TaxID=2818037 RepID=UPI00226A2621|nr:hypothetical protein [Snodgrassella sp. B3882]MCX8745408.1 hypothetical protein [Snodgrassella sp. B3882]